MGSHRSDPPSNAVTAVPTVEPFEGTDSEWDRIVSSLSGSTFCHLSGWRRVLGSAFGHDVSLRVAVDAAGAVVGALPLARVRSRIFGDYLLSMPFLSYGGPIGSDDARLALVESAVRDAERLGVDLLELRSRDALPGGLTISDRKITVLKTLPDSADELWQDGLRAKVRSQIRRPQKAGMEVRYGVELVDAFYRVFSHTMRDLGTPVLPRRFFEAVATELTDEVVFVTVHHEDRCVAAGCGFSWQGEVEITWAGALRDVSRLAPNMLLYWSFMEESIRRGARTFNFGRCSPGSGTHRFKRQWDAEDHPLPWMQWSPRGVAATPNPESAKFRMARAVWSRLPLRLANAVGPWLSRSLP